MGEASRSLNPAHMHLANTYASDLLTWQKDAKTFVERWRINLPYSAERLEATWRMDQDHLFLLFFNGLESGRYSARTKKFRPKINITSGA
jgi:hypothetical protein